MTETNRLMVALLGAADSGKTAWLQRFTTGRFDPVKENVTWVGWRYVNVKVESKNNTHHLRLIDIPAPFIPTKNTLPQTSAAIVFYTPATFQETVESVKMLRKFQPETKITSVISFHDCTRTTAIDELAEEIIGAVGGNVYYVSAKTNFGTNAPVQDIFELLFPEYVGFCDHITPEIPQYWKVKTSTTTLANLTNAETSLAGDTENLLKLSKEQDVEIASLRARVKELTSENTSLKSWTDLGQECGQELLAEVDERDAKIASMQNEISQLTSEVVLAKALKEGIDLKNKCINTITEENEKLKSENEKLQSENEKLKEQNEKLKDQNEILESRDQVCVTTHLTETVHGLNQKMKQELRELNKLSGKVAIDANLAKMIPVFIDKINALLEKGTLGNRGFGMNSAIGGKEFDQAKTLIEILQSDTADISSEPLCIWIPEGLLH